MIRSADEQQVHAEKEVMKKRMRLSRAAKAANRKRRLFKRVGVVTEIIPNRKTSPKPQPQEFPQGRRSEKPS